MMTATATTTNEFTISITKTLLLILKALPITDKVHSCCDPSIYSKWIAEDVIPLLIMELTHSTNSTTAAATNDDGSEEEEEENKMNESTSEKLLCSVVRWCVNRARLVELEDGKPHRALIVADTVGAVEPSCLATPSPPTTLSSLSSISYPWHAMSTPREQITTMRTTGSIHVHFRCLVGLRTRLRELVHLHGKFDGVV
jgi:hypothetical protein